jgi:uncharacterized membrane protein (DUF106 family)
MSPIAVEIAVIAMVISIASAIVNKKVTNQKRMKEIKNKVSDFQKRYNEAKKGGNKELIAKMEHEQKEVMALSMEMMTGSFKPMLFTFLPIIIIFLLLQQKYMGEDTVITLPVLGTLGWFWWYFIVAIVAGLSFEVIYKVVTKEKKK